jgi:hypothetical protein
MAEAVIEGKASVPTVAVGEDEFVELDEGGQPKKKSARGRQRPQATVRKKAPARRRLPPAKAALPESEDAAAEGLDELDEAEEAEVAAAVVAPLVVVEEHQPAPGRRKPRGDDEGGSLGE